MLKSVPVLPAVLAPPGVEVAVGAQRQAVVEASGHLRIAARHGGRHGDIRVIGKRQPPGAPVPPGPELAGGV